MEIDEHIEAGERYTQECMEHLGRFHELLKEGLQDSLEVLKSVRETLTDADDIKDFDARIAETQARIADIEAA